MKSIIRFVTVLTLPIIAFGAWSCRHNTEATVAPPVRVSVMAVENRNIGASNAYSGTVKSKANTTVSFSVAGTITDIYVDEGQKVSSGQIIARIKSADYVNANNIAQAQLNEARDAYERLKKLHDQNALPDIKWVEMENKLKQAENAAEISARALDDATLRSPVSGVVSRKIADVGQSVVPVEPIVEIVSMDELTIDIPVPEQQIGSISEGQTALIDFSSIDVKGLEGKVVQKSVVADPLTRSYTVKISLPSAGGKILPGMVGDVTFQTLDNDENGTAVILLPAQAVLLSSDNHNFVWVVKDGKAEKRSVIANELVRNGVAVEQGLFPGDTVIVEGMQKVGSGTFVEPLPVNQSLK